MNRLLLFRESVVFSGDFEIALGVIADGADFGSLGADHNMAAVAAFPDFDLALFDHLLHLNVLQQGTVAFLVMLFDCGNTAELRGEFRESFLFRCFGEGFVHIGPLLVFTVGRGGQVVRGGTDALEFLEPHLGMLFFVLGSLQEQG